MDMTSQVTKKSTETGRACASLDSEAFAYDNTTKIKLWEPLRILYQAFSNR